MNNQTKIGLLFGGVSSEHEVSCVSACTVLGALRQAGYDVLPMGITKDGRWYAYSGSPEAMADGSWKEDTAHLTKCVLSPDREDHGVWLHEEGGLRLEKLDVVFPVLHGRNGEDGTMQGLLELAAIPYVGCGVLASAVCMDKAVANTLLDAAGVARCEWDWAWRADCKDFDALEERLAAKLGYPIFVKPANAGSSVGISKAADKEALRKAIDVALAEDDKVVFERFVEGQEVECAAIGNIGGESTTRPGEVLAADEFYTYDDKYKNGVSRTVIPANLSEEKLDEVKEQARRAYRVLGCAGLSRCDFFVEKGTGRVLLNELNTLPGFTSISMYPKLMESAGVSLTELVTRLVDLALERAEAQNG